MHIQIPDNQKAAGDWADGREKIMPLWFITAGLVFSLVLFVALVVVRGSTEFSDFDGVDGGLTMISLIGTISFGLVSMRYRIVYQATDSNNTKRLRRRSYICRFATLLQFISLIISMILIHSTL